MGRAMIMIPACAGCKGFSVDGLSDELADSYAGLFARMLSDQDGNVLVSHSDDTTAVFGFDTIKNRVEAKQLSATKVWAAKA